MCSITLGDGMHTGERQRQAACAVTGTIFEGYLKQSTAAQHPSSLLDCADLLKIFYNSHCLMNGE
jgi:hypothetical protein